MVQRIGSLNRKTRALFKKNYKEKGKRSTSEYFKELNPGEKVLIRREPSSTESQFHSRFNGKTGTIIGKRGSCYLVKVSDVKKEKELIIHPIHLKRIETNVAKSNIKA
ncbi:MAG: large subunit ribosomal protein L21e [Candidatus Woesearchaeota archaeon]|nr:large subunit ribosomal protein L21e [Candidatus Woesearchaeota archaeon]